MLSIVVSVLVALLVSAVVYPIFGTWYAPIVPALLAGGLTFYGLFQFFSKRVQNEIVGIQGLLAGRDIDGAEALLDSIRSRYGKWVLLLDQQISAQKGMLRYAQMKWDEAKPLLAKGTLYNWQARTALAAIAYRQGDKEECWKQLDKASNAGGKEAMVFVVWAVLATRAGDRDRALDALSKGLKKLPDSKVLKDLHKKVANKKKIKPKDLPEAWFHFFPEDLMQQMMVKGRKGGPPQLPPGVQPRYQQPFPQPRGASKKMRRG